MYLGGELMDLREDVCFFKKLLNCFTERLLEVYY